MLIDTTSKSAPPSLPCKASSAGISLRQGTHQVAHRFSSTVRPRQSASDFAAPLASLKASSGRRFRGAGDRNGGDLAADQRRHPAGGFHRSLAGRVGARIACQAANPVYPRQSDRDAGHAAQNNQGEPFLGVRARGVVRTVHAR